MEYGRPACNNQITVTPVMKKRHQVKLTGCPIQADT